MKTLIAVALSAILLAGCVMPFGGAAKKEERAAAKVKATERRAETNQLAQVRQGAGMTDAGLWAVSRNPSPTVYDDVAKMMLGRAVLSFQNADAMPPASEILALRKMVDSLLSSNAVLRTEGSNALARSDAAMRATERKEQALAGQLEAMTAKWEQAAREAAQASTLFGFAKRLFWWAVWIGGGLFLLRVAAVFIPPPYNSVIYLIDAAVGGFCRLLFGVFSKAKSAAKVVAADAHEVSEETLTRIIGAVQKARANPAAAAVLDPLLLSATDEDYHRLKIKEIKAGLRNINPGLEVG